MAIRLPPPYLQNRTDHTAENDRLVMSILSRAGTALLSTPGGVRYTDGTDLSVAQTVSPSMNVLVKTGQGLIDGTESTYQGTYAIINDADIQLAIAASSPTLPRKDAI